MMSRFSTSILAGAVLLAAPMATPAQAAAPLSAAPAQTIEISPEAVDFGDVFSGEDLSQWVTFTNRSDTDWCIQRVKPSCGCTVATVHGPDDTEVDAQHSDGSAIVCVPPGQSLKVQVEFHTRNQVGSVEKSLGVYHMDKAMTALSVPVRARISRAIMVNPTFVQFGNVAKRQPAEQEVVIEANNIGDFEIIGFESALDGNPLPEALKFELLDKEGASRRVKVSLEGPRPVGQLFAKVRVKLDHERVKETEFTVIGIVDSDVQFSSGHPTFPEALVFDKAAAGSELTRTLKVSNSDPETPYVLESVEVLSKSSDFFDTKIRTIKEGESYEIDLTARLEADLGSFFRGNLRLNANHPDMPAKTIAFHGWVQKAQ